MKEDYPVLKRDFPLNEAQLGWWTDEQKSPYIEDKRFDWYRSYQMGGRSLLWGRHSYRFNKMDFERSEEHTSELQSRGHLVCRLLLEEKKALAALVAYE